MSIKNINQEQYKTRVISFEVSCNYFGNELILKQVNDFLNNHCYCYKNLKSVIISKDKNFLKS